MFINYWNRFKYRKVVKGVVGKIKEDIKENEEPKLVYKLEVYTTDGKVSEYTNHRSTKAYFEFMDWYMCSDNLYYNFRYNNGMRIFARDKISSINVFEKKENEK